MRLKICKINKTEPAGINASSSFIFYFIGCLSIATGYSQQVISNNLSASDSSFNVIFLDINHYVDLEISTSGDVDSFEIEEQQKGEYGTALLFNSFVSNDTLFIKDPVHPAFQFPQDKLSAHKITDSKASIILPKNKTAFLNLLNSNLDLEGDFKNVIINIQQGTVDLINLTGDIAIVSVDASVTTSLSSDYDKVGFSRNGKMIIDQSTPNNRYVLKVESINGNLNLH